MTTQTWIYIAAGFALATITLISFFRNRAVRGKMTRQWLHIYVSSITTSLIFGFLFFSGALLVMYLAAILIMNIPPIMWILRLPKDDHVA